jgi:hypothetical protein
MSRREVYTIASTARIEQAEEIGRRRLGPHL